MTLGTTSLPVMGNTFFPIAGRRANSSGRGGATPCGPPRDAAVPSRARRYGCGSGVLSLEDAWAAKGTRILDTNIDLFSSSLDSAPTDSVAPVQATAKDRPNDASAHPWRPLEAKSSGFDSAPHCATGSMRKVLSHSQLNLKLPSAGFRPQARSQKNSGRVAAI